MDIVKLVYTFFRVDDLILICFHHKPFPSKKKGRQLLEREVLSALLKHYRHFAYFQFAVLSSTTAKYPVNVPVYCMVLSPTVLFTL